MRISGLKICIVDDEKTYFNNELLALAKEKGFGEIERHYNIDQGLFLDLHKNSRDIIILDIQGITDESVAKDGLQVAASLVEHTNTYVV